MLTTTEQSTLPHLGINFKFPSLPYGNCALSTQHFPEEAPYTRRMIFPATAHHHSTAFLSTSGASRSYVVAVGILAFEEIDSLPITGDVIHSHVTPPPTPPFQGIDKRHPPHCSITRAGHRERVSDSYLLFHDCCNFEAI